MIGKDRHRAGFTKSRTPDQTCRCLHSNINERCPANGNGHRAQEAIIRPHRAEHSAKQPERRRTAGDSRRTGPAARRGRLVAYDSPRQPRRRPAKPAQAAAPRTPAPP
ncbi:MAG TPA: hypothetical protein DHV64_12595 [Erythrobacter sp.]|nr:hypothetical protein [Erythrobacter sp.]